MIVLPDLIRILQDAHKHGWTHVEIPVAFLKKVAVRLHDLGDPMDSKPQWVGEPVSAQPTGDVCQTCGGMLVQTGKCRTCQACGTSDGGCS